MRLNKKFALHCIDRIYLLAFTLVFTLVLSSARANASEQTGTIKSIEVIHDGRINVWLNGGTRSDMPSCVNFDYWYIADEESQVGREQFNILLSAFVSGRSVKVVGTGSCNRWVDGEDIASVTLQ